MIVRRIAATVALLLVVSGCSREMPPPVGLVPVPTQTPPPPFDLGPEACPAALLEGTLVRHEEAGLAVDADPNFPPTVVVWPHGWVARDADGVRELLDGNGRAVAREGDFVSAGGGSYPPRDWFHPCGRIEFTAAD